MLCYICQAEQWAVWMMLFLCRVLLWPGLTETTVNRQKLRPHQQHHPWSSCSHEWSMKRLNELKCSFLLTWHRCPHAYIHPRRHTHTHTKLFQLLKSLQGFFFLKTISGDKETWDHSVRYKVFILQKMLKGFFMHQLPKNTLKRTYEENRKTQFSLMNAYFLWILNPALIWVPSIISKAVS